MLAAIAFLRELERHNDRAWFAARRERYLADVLLPMQEFVRDLSAACEKRRIPIHGDARRSIFRVYRDIRFSADKRPFATFAAAYLSRDASRSSPGGFYIRIDPAGSWMSLAFYLPPAPMLARWRASMAARPQEFSRVVRSLAAKGLNITQPGEWDDALKRMPRGFEAMADSPLAPYFRLRSFAVRRRLTQRELGARSLVATALRFIEDGGPLLRYGWRFDQADDAGFGAT